MPVPSKVVAFAWKVLLNRIPTKVNLRVRNILPLDGSEMCVLCNRREETCVHLFIHCDFANSVWRRVMTWVDYDFITPPIPVCSLGVLGN